MRTIKNTERLSSGLRINRSADDAAGLAISEKMRNQIRGLDQAIRNVQDGISLLQVMDGGLSKIHEILARQRELTVQALNDVYTMVDRLNIQIEIDQLSEEITSMAYNTEFNNLKLLASKTGFRTETVTQSLFLDPFFVSQPVFSTAQTIPIDVMVDAGIKRDLFYFDINVVDDSLFAWFNSAITMHLPAGAWNMQNTDFILTAPTGQEFRVTIADVGGLSGYIPDTAYFFYATPGFAIVIGRDAYVLDILFDEVEAYPRPAYNGRWIFSIDNRRNEEAVRIYSQISMLSVLLAPHEDNATVRVGFIEQQELNLTRRFGFSEIQIQSGANPLQRTVINLFDVTAENLGVHNLNILSLQQANSALLQIDNAVNTVSAYRAKSGSQQNRLEHTLKNLRVAHENTSVSNSRIRDADMAQEIIHKAKLKIKEQSTIFIFAKTNNPPNIFLLMND